MKYPKDITPTVNEQFSVDNKLVQIPKCIVSFKKWTGKPLKESFGGKPVVSIGNKPMFAEMAIMKHFVKDGWKARWIETYGKSKTKPIMLARWKDDKFKNQVGTLIRNRAVNKLLNEIAKNNGNSYSGCWDVFAWKGKRVVFAESKRTRRDRIRTTQTNWLDAGLKSGLSPDNFLVVQWDY